MNKEKGVLTSEFWLTVAVIVAATALMLFKAIDQETFKWIFSLPVMGYGLSRGISKINGGSK